MTAHDCANGEDAPRRRRWWPHLGWVVLVLACLAGGHLGGVAATQLVPAHVTTDEISADVVLTLTDVDQVVVTTTLGDVVLVFDSGWRASGIRISPQVEGGALEGAENLSAWSLDRVRPLARQAAQELALRYGAGAVAGVVIAVLLVPPARRALRRRVLVGVVVTAVVIVTQGVGTARTYTAANFQAYRADGLLGAALAEGRFVGARLTERTDGLAKYLTRWQALQRELARPQNDGQEIPALDGPSFLLVSDIHGINDEPVIRQLVETNQVQAVIDTGDLLNAGYVQEAELTGIFDGIQSLGVPYIFVLGNHDRRSEGDRTLIERMQQIPNVTLVMPDPATLNLIEVGGIRIAGVNDELRWFGDDDTGNARKQVHYTNLFNDAFDDDPPDLALTHEPSGARRMQAPIRLAGHFHRPSVERDETGVLITNGTLTGGGIFGQNDAVKQPGEVTEQTVMILTYSGDCRSAVLRTIDFSGQLDGQFAVHRMSQDYLAGSEEPGRTCSPDGELSVTPVSIAEGDEQPS